MSSPEETFRQHREALVRYVYQLTADAAAAEDVVQETYMRLLETEPEDENLRAWLFTVATNLVRNRARVASRRRELEAGEPDPEPAPSADERAAEKRRLESVWAAIDQLPARDRALLLLRVEGLTYEEIAEAVGVARGSVGPLTGRALQRLREELGDHDVDRDE